MRRNNNSMWEDTNTSYRRESRYDDSVRSRRSERSEHFHSRSDNNRNMGYGRNVVDVEDVLETLRGLIISAEVGQITPTQIAQEIERLADANLIEIIGEGTNRLVVRLNQSIDHLIDFSGDVVIKIPYTTKEGIDDNTREYLLYKYLLDSSRNNGEVQKLVKILPAVSMIRGFEPLIAQEFVIPIHEHVAKEYKTVRENEVAGFATKEILEKYHNDYKRLLRLLDKYCIISDLDPMITPFQYGFKRVDGQYTLTILDTGYTIPKLPEIQRFIANGDIEDMEYLIYGDNIGVDVQETSTGEFKYNMYALNNAFPSVVLHNIVTNIWYTTGLYMKKVIKPSDTPEMVSVSDMTYFKKIYRLLLEEARNNGNSKAAEYFSFLSANKSIY